MKKIIFSMLLLLSAITNAQKGYEFSFESGYAFGLGNDKVNTISIISMINGYRINPLMYCGIGFGLEYTSAEKALLPLYGQFKYNFNSNNTAPFVLLNAGYSFGESSEKLEGIGIFFAPYFGVDFKKNSKTSFYCMIGLNFQRALEYTPSRNNMPIIHRGITPYIKKHKFYSFIPIKIGIRL